MRRRLPLPAVAGLLLASLPRPALASGPQPALEERRIGSTQATPRAAALEQLQQAQERLGLEEMEFGTPVEREGLGGSYFRFPRLWRGLPVFDDELVLAIGAARPGEQGLHTLWAIRRALRDFSSWPAGTASVRSPEAALAAARHLVAARGAERVPAQVELGLDRDADGAARLAFRVRLATTAPTADEELLLDAESLALRSRRDRRVGVDGIGLAYDTNPIVEAGDATLRPPTGGGTTPELDALRIEVALHRLEGTGVLSGEWVDARPSNAANRARSSTESYAYDRSESGLREVMAYFHTDRVQDLFQTTYGLTRVNARRQVAIVDDSAEDNSYFSPFDRATHFGRGGVPDAEDGDIVMHEYGHAVQHDQVPNFGSGGDEGSIGEGFSDYLAGTVGERFAPGFDPECIGEWDATAYSRATVPCLRRLDEEKHWPEGGEDEVHADGELWSATLWRLRAALGAPTVDVLALEGHFLMGTRDSFEEAFQAFRAADTQLNQGLHRDLIYREFIASGLSRETFPPSPLTDVVGTVALQQTPVLTPEGTYRRNTDETFRFTFPGAQAVRPHFRFIQTEEDRSCFSRGCDNLYVFDGRGLLYGVLHGEQADTFGPVVPGDTVELRLISDRSVQQLGYLVDRIDALGIVTADSGFVVLDGGVIPPVDAGAPDAGPPDAGPVDAGSADAGPVDAGLVDAGPADGGSSGSSGSSSTSASSSASSSSSGSSGAASSSGSSSGSSNGSSSSSGSGSSSGGSTATASASTGASGSSGSTGSGAEGGGCDCGPGGAPVSPFDLAAGFTALLPFARRRRRS